MISIHKKEIKYKPDDSPTKNKNDRKLSYYGKNKNPMKLVRKVKRKVSSYNGKIYRKNACEKAEVLRTRLARDEKTCSSSKLAHVSTANPQGYSYTKKMSWQFKYTNNASKTQVIYKSLTILINNV